EGEPRAEPHEPYGHALWPGRPADAWGGFGHGGTAARRHGGTAARRHGGTAAKQQGHA
ncbi:MAG: hypothetical protein ACI8WY_003380, partial [Planctomycetota bacterium]